MESRRSWRPIRGEDLLESDVWEVMEESRKTREPEQASIGLLSRQLETAARLIPRGKEANHELKMAQNSAPVNIPNWSKVYGNSPKRNSCTKSSFVDHRSSDEECEDDQDCRLPPHEWLARNETRNQISSFSVHEGAGRTLKGRDLSRVRHAVLTKTGFI